MSWVDWIVLEYKVRLVLGGLGLAGGIAWSLSSWLKNRGKTAEPPRYESLEEPILGRKTDDR